MRLIRKYRPKAWDDIIGQEKIKEQVFEIAKRIKGGETNVSIGFFGQAGTGKTSTAEVFARYVLDGHMSSFLELNASDERGIAVVRTRIKTFARTVGRRVLLLDEADNMTDDAQHALRRTMDKTLGTIFILSGNYEHKIIEPIKSRLALFRFRALTEEEVMTRLFEICQAEGMEIKTEHKEGFALLVKQAGGDLRKAINTLETIITSDKQLTPEVLVSLARPNLAGSAMTFALHGDFKKAQELIETAFIRERFNAEMIIEDLYGFLKTVDEGTPSELTIRLYQKLAETETAISNGGTPIIQLMGLISYAWIAPHLKGVLPI